jgi:hypothetical protein
MLSDLTNHHPTSHLFFDAGENVAATGAGALAVAVAGTGLLSEISGVMISDQAVTSTTR